MKTYQIILIIIAIGIGLYFINNMFNKTEHMANNIPDEIAKLLSESNEETYYSEESDEENDSESIADSKTSIDNDSLPVDSATSITGEETKIKSRPAPEASPEGLLNPVSEEQGAPIDRTPITKPISTGKLHAILSESNFSKEEIHPRLRHEHDHVFPGMEKPQCTVGDTTDNADDYIRRLVLEGQNYCSNNKCADKSVIKNYREDFFDFRDKTWDNSRRNDMAYKVARLYLEGNTKLTDRVRGRKVKDIYDDLTRAQVIRDKNCVKRGDFDDTLHHGYYNTQGVGETHLGRDNWMYMNDVKPKNKIIDQGVLGFDPHGSSQSLVEVGKRYEK